jgi:hypothetical protein
VFGDEGASAISPSRSTVPNAANHADAGQHSDLS